MCPSEVEVLKKLDGSLVFDRKSLIDKGPVFLAGYRKETSTALKILRSATQKKVSFNVLVFGPPGTGKTAFQQFVAYTEAKEQSTDLRLISVPAYVWLASRQDMSNFLDSFFDSLETRSPEALIVGLEEVEATASRRARDPFSQSYTVMSFMDRINETAATKQIGAVIFLSTSYPDKIDEGILSRVNYTIYLHPPSSEEIQEILRHFGIPDPSRVAEILHIRLEGERISRSGLINACENIRKLGLEYADDAWENAELLMANAIIAQKSDSVDEYELKFKYLIEKSDATITFWQGIP